MNSVLKAGIAAAIIICGQLFFAVFIIGCNDSPAVNGDQAIGTVRLYTSVPEATVAIVKNRFENDYPGVSLEVFRAGTGDVMALINEQAGQGQVQADVVWMADPSAAEALKEKGLLVPYVSPAAADIPPVLLDAHGYYSGSRLLNMVVAYNTSMVPEAPRSYRDLLQAEYEGKIGLASPDRSGASFYAVGVFILDQDYGWEYIYQLHQNGCQILEDNQQATEKIASGQLAMGIVLDYAVRQIQEKEPEAPIDYIFFPDGVISIAGPVAIMSDCQNDAAARAFVDWLMSEQGQICLVEEASIMPVNSRVELDEGMISLQEINVIPSNARDIYRNTGHINRIYHDIFAGQPLEEIDATVED